MPLLIFRIYTYRSNMFWNHMIKSAYWRALCEKILKVCLSVFVYITVSPRSCMYRALRGDKVSMLSHIYPHKPLRKIELAICSPQADSPLYVWLNV